MNAAKKRHPPDLLQNGSPAANRQYFNIRDFNIRGFNIGE
jgi:hypothetical protein